MRPLFWERSDKKVQDRKLSGLAIRLPSEKDARNSGDPLSGALS